MKLSVTTSLHCSLHLSNRLIQCCSHCCKNSPILIMDAVVKLVNQILWCLKWLVCICTMNCFMCQVQKEWFGGVVWVDQIYSMVCEHIGAVISPLVMHRLQNLQKGILKYSFCLKKYEEVILKERDKMGFKSWIAGKTWCGIKCVGEKSDSPYTSSLKMEMMIQGWIYEGRGARGMYLSPAPSLQDDLQLHGDTKSAVSFAMYSQKFTPCHCPVITLLLQQSIKTYFLVVHPLLQNILNLPPIMTMIMIMTTTMMIKYCAVGICRGSHESLLVWDLKTKEISVHVHVPLYCS